MSNFTEPKGDKKAILREQDLTADTAYKIMEKAGIEDAYEQGASYYLTIHDDGTCSLWKRGDDLFSLAYHDDERQEDDRRRKRDSDGWRACTPPNE